MHWEVLPYPSYTPDLASRDFRLTSPLRESQGGKIFGADDEIKHFVQRWLDKQPQTLFERGIMKVPER